MILANFAQQNRNTISEWGIRFSNPFAQFKPSHFPKFYCGDSHVDIETDKSAFNNGYNGQYAWHQAPKGGGLGAGGSVRGTGALTADAWAVKLADAGLTGTGDLTAIGSLIVQALAALTGSGTVSAANLQAFLSAVASLTGSGTVSAATVTGFGELLAALTASGTAAGSTLTGSGQLAASILSYGSLTPEGIRDSVWQAILANYPTVGTAGKTLASAGGAADPWLTTLPGAYGAGTAGDIIGNLLVHMGTRLVDSGYSQDEVTRLMASILVGKVSGGGTGTETFRDLADTKNRIVATVDASGNRTSVTKDAA